AHEDADFGGFGSAPKFPVAPVLGFLLAGGGDGADLAARTMKAMGASALRDSVEGGFFRYATRRDWTEPHYERMLSDNALLLDVYTAAWLQRPEERTWAATVARETARFLLEQMLLPDGGFASAQDSESTIDGRRSEGGYYALDREARTHEVPPALDRKVLTGWNGLAIGALARAGVALDRPEWIEAAGRTADLLLDRHVLPDRLVRASLDGRVSAATATLEDYGMLAGGLLDLALASGEVRYAEAARSIIDATMAAAGGTADSFPFAVPGGADPVLSAQGLALGFDPSEGATPSGITATADAANVLHLLTADSRYRDAARRALSVVAAGALANPLAAGGALGALRRLAAPVVQLVTVLPAGAAGASASDLVEATRRHPASVRAIVTDAQAAAFAAAGFDLFAGRASVAGEAAAYLCSDFVCRLPAVRAADLA
ncbi:MAG: thioredoxin domain-containing protein, partial [Leifsonia sp.]